MNRLIINAPVRVDLAGGTLDIWPLSAIVPGAATVNCTLNAGISLAVDPCPDATVLRNRNSGNESDWPTSDPDLKYLSAVLDLYPGQLDTGWRFTVHSDVPQGSGLGTSSVILSAMLTACNRLTGRAMTSGELVRIAMDLEAGLIRFPTGIQDYIAPLYGGISRITFPPGGFHVDSLPFPTELSRHSLLIFTGIHHFSGTPNWEVFKLMLDDARYHGTLEALAEISADVSSAILAGDMASLGRSLRADFEIRKALPVPLVPDCPELFNMLESDPAIMGFRMCGAAGGGCVFAVVEPDFRQSVTDKLEKTPYRVLDIRPEQRRLTIEDA